MTPEAQQLAIAKACGYDVAGERKRLELCRRDDANPGKSPIPDYLHDLNAMAVAEKTLEYPGRHAEQVELNLYAETLRRISLANRNHYTFQATAAQRAEAFLKTLNLWVEETESQPCP